MIVLFILALVIALAAHMGFDRHRETIHRPIIHWQSAGLVLLISAIVGYITQIVIDLKYGKMVPEGYYRWWQFAGLSLGIHFCFFDLLWNIMHGHDWNYQGEASNPNRSWSDKAWDYVAGTPWIYVFIRFFVPLVGGCIYFGWDKVVGDNNIRKLFTSNFEVILVVSLIVFFLLGAIVGHKNRR